MQSYGLGRGRRELLKQGWKISGAISTCRHVCTEMLRLVPLYAAAERISEIFSISVSCSLAENCQVLCSLWMMQRRSLTATSIYFTKCLKLLRYNFKLEQYALYVPKSMTESISLSKESLINYLVRKVALIWKKNDDKAEEMERDFSPVCILTLKFLISHLITAKVMLFCLAHVPWKTFQATINITEGLENNRGLGMEFWILG